MISFIHHKHLHQKESAPYTMPFFLLRPVLHMLGIVIAVSLLFITHISAQETVTLQKGIDLYNAEKDDAALSVFNDVVKEHPQCPLAYYYAALIRMNKEQYSRAQANLEKALSDSADFYDVYAYLAITNRETGNTEQAMDSWQHFVNGVGVLEQADNSSPDAIIPPEAYRLRLAEEEIARKARIELEQERERQRLEELARAKQEQERLAAEATEDSLAALAALVTSQTDNTLEQDSDGNSLSSNIDEDAIPETDQQNDTPDEESSGITLRDTPLGDFEDRISADFKMGMIGFVVFIAVVFFIIVGMYYGVIHRRKKGNDEVEFSEQVERLLDDLKFEVDEDSAIRDFESRKREIAKELASLKSATTDTPVTQKSELELPILQDNTAFLDEKQDEPAESVPFSAIAHPGVFRKPPITEEVKMLVSRLFREGKSAEEIAHVSDLTTTEVNLILAVRERKLEKTVADIHQEDVHHEHDQLFTAITNLQAEGATPREIARQLDLSLSEVELAASIMSIRNRASD